MNDAPLASIAVTTYCTQKFLDPNKNNRKGTGNHINIKYGIRTRPNKNKYTRFCTDNGGLCKRESGSVIGGRG
jgi:hypothetical protein